MLCFSFNRAPIKMYIPPLESWESGESNRVYTPYFGGQQKHILRPKNRPNRQAGYQTNIPPTLAEVGVVGWPGTSVAVDAEWEEMKDGDDHHKEMQDALHEYWFKLHVRENNDNLLEVETHGDDESISPFDIMWNCMTYSDEEQIIFYAATSPALPRDAGCSTWVSISIRASCEGER